MPSLFVIRGNDQGARFELDRSIIAIGREAGNEIQLHDTEVSRRHAQLESAQGTYRLRDLESSNGSFVNGQRVVERHLASGDHLHLGGTELLFTGATGESHAHLDGRIDIVDHQHHGDSSRIVSAVTQEEGSRIFQATGSSQSPWLTRAKSNLQVMYRTALAVSHTLDIDQLLDRIMQLIFEWVEADRGVVMLLDPTSNELIPKVRRDRTGGESADKISISQTILDYVREKNEGVLTSNAKEDDRFDPAASILQSNIREAICVPMQGRYDVVGVIYIDTATPAGRVIRESTTHRFTDDHLKLMVAIGHQAALAVEDTRYYSAMVQAERLAAVGQTIATLSHHIKNILQGVRGGSFLIEEGLDQHDQQLIAKGWGIVERNQQKISALVLDMLTFSKEREPEQVAGDLSQVVTEVVELMQPHATQMGVQLRLEIDPQMPILSFDPEGIHRAVLNIITNAIDACDKEEEGRVDVTTRFVPDDGLVEVVIEDNGLGIPPEDIENIFTLFVSRKGGRGTGLGLPVSNKILKEHGGQILVDSQPGRGSRFTLRMPAVSPPDEEL